MKKYRVKIEWPKISYEIEATDSYEAEIIGSDLFAEEYDNDFSKFEPLVTAKEYKKITKGGDN